ncbi:MAG: glycosyltransferase [Rikenellaceae bacterium]
MKILHYTPTIDRRSGGIGTYIQLLAKELGKLVELHIVTRRSECELELDNCTLHHISRGILWRTKRQWLSILRSVEPDIIHINCCWTPQCAFVQRWSEQRGYRVVLSPHGMLEPWIVQRNYWLRKLPALLLYQRHAIFSATLLVATSESERRNLLELGYNPRVEVVANGVEVESIKMKSSWRRHRRLLYLSRLHVKKGVEYLIDAVALLGEELRSYEVVVAGEGNSRYVEELRARVVSRGVEDMVTLCGAIYGDKKWALLRNSDLFVLPTHSENFGIVVAEALACGTPVVTTIGTPWSELASCHCGWYTEVGVAATVAAIREFLATTESELERMGHNGRAVVERRYSTSIVAHQMLSLYERTRLL